MHAVIGRVSFDPSRQDEAVAALNNMVIPRVKEAPGAVAGYWWHESDGHGIGLVVFEDEASARAGAEAAKEAPRPDFVTFEGNEVYEIVGSL
jgi:hypothetical protein